MTLLLADIGATNTRCALASGSDVGPVTHYRNSEHADLGSLLRGYLDTTPAERRPRRAALSVAAPIRDDRIRLSNINWQLSRQALRNELELDELLIVNDFAALARALPELADDELCPAGGGTAITDAPRVVLGPGTGLGVAGIAWTGRRWLVLPGEGGHATLSAGNAKEERLLRVARERYGHGSAERLLCGQGLSFIHEVLHGGPALAPEIIGNDLLQDDLQAVESFALFFSLLGGMAGNLALTFGAFGGVYVGGGIVPRYLEAFRRSGFRQRFEAKGRFRSYLEDIPTWVITGQVPALKGLIAMEKELRRGS